MNSYFKAALPIWEKGKEREINLRLQFKAVVCRLEKATVSIATSGMYQLWINGEFVCYGPARAGKNHFRMDKIDVGDRLSKENNIIIIEVAGYNTNSYAIQNQASFLQAEVVSRGEAVAFTGRDFTARKNPYYCRRAQRYSFQRPMIEGYNFNCIEDGFYTDTAALGDLTLAETAEKCIIPRYAPYPAYEKLAACQIGFGRASLTSGKEPWRDRSVINIGEDLIGFKAENLELFPTEECRNVLFAPATQEKNSCISALEYAVYKLEHEASGFLTAEINCKQNTRIYILFDELINDDGYVDYLRMDCVNAVRFDLCAGTHKLHMFEVYSMQYIQIAVMSGECEIKNVGMTEYKHLPVKIPALKDEKLQKVAAAAAESFRQNTVDIYTDCPSRERAGWLCDSLFIARTEFYTDGKSVIEKGFLENFLHEENYDYLPDGMLPMCYPADFYDGNFIPQWSLWLVLQLREYIDRSGDGELINRFKLKLKRLFEYFKGFENSDGLLEDLAGWQFVEWSKANELTDGVNYPTNMLYSAALKAAGELYCNAEYTEKSERVKNEVLKQSFNGEFFADNALRKNGELIHSGEITETCQYYAFFLGIASEKSHPQLFKTLMEEFGPHRKNPERYKHIYPSAPFIGYFLRLEILAEQGMLCELAKNIEEYYYGMALTTGTLWEHADLSERSCCHGFSGYILCWLGKLAENGF